MMKPFTDTRLGISGLKPQGWSSEALGFWIRTRDDSVLFQRAIPNASLEQIKTGLLPRFGFPKLQDRTGRYKTVHFSWDLYHQKFELPSGQAMLVDAALAKVGKWAYLVILAAVPSKHASLHENIFLPALNALAPVFTGPEAGKEARERAEKYGETITSMRHFMKANLTVESDWVSDQNMGLVMPPAQKACDPNLKQIILPKPDASVLKKADIMACIADRKSVRKFNLADLTLAELSYLLWATQGVRQGSPAGRHYRTVPSAGSRHSFETYLVIQHVESLETGIYRYLPFDHKLVFLFSSEDLPAKMTGLASGQAFVGNCAVCFIWTSIPYRMEWRYCIHSERVILMDVGHVCQNLYLAAGSIGCGTCGVGAYEQKELDRFLGLDGRDEFVIYLAPVGKVSRDLDE